MENNNHLIFDNTDIVELSKRYKTPFFFISENKLEENYRRFILAFSKISKLNIFYSLKTNFESLVLKTLKGLGAGAEVSGELDTLLAEKAGFLPDNIVVDGPCKSGGTIKKSLLRNFHIINAESLQELFQINNLAKRYNRVASVGLRIDPLLIHYNVNRIFEYHHKKFGFLPEDIESLQRKLKGLDYIKIKGLLTHTNIPLPKPNDYKIILRRLFYIANRLRKFGIEIETINIGGGFPPLNYETYRNSTLIQKIFRIDKIITIGIEELGKVISECYIHESKRYNLEPILSLEPGKAIVDDINIIVGKIIDIFRGWALTDISINDFDVSRPIFKRPFVIANKINHKPTIKISIGGPTLKPNDVLYLNVSVPKLEIGDIFVISNTGAYSISLSNQFTRPRNAVYFKSSSGKIELIRRKETPEDVIHTQIW